MSEVRTDSETASAQAAESTESRQETLRERTANFFNNALGSGEGRFVTATIATMTYLYTTLTSGLWLKPEGDDMFKLVAANIVAAVAVGTIASGKMLAPEEDNSVSKKDESSTTAKNH